METQSSSSSTVVLRSTASGTPTLPRSCKQPGQVQGVGVVLGQLERGGDVAAVHGHGR